MSTANEALLSAHSAGYTLPDGRVLFSGLSFGLGRERVGLVGRNGIGKTTLARIVAGELEPTSGTVVRGGRVAYLPQRRVPAEPARTVPAEPARTVPAEPARTVAALLGLSARLAALDRVLAGSTDPADYQRIDGQWDLRERVVAELERLGLGGLPLDRPAAAVSGGEATRLALAGRILERPDLLVLDEPTNDLDAEGRLRLYDWVEGWRAGLLVITHDRALLERVDRILELTSLGARSYGGGWSLYSEQREAEADAAEQELAHARRALRVRERDARAARERQERRAARGRRGRATANVPKILLNARRERAEKTTARLGDVVSQRIDEAAERVAAAKERVEEVDRVRLEVPSTGLHSTRLVAALRGVRYTHPGATRPVLEDVDLTIVGPERLAITGPNGSGKTTLLRILLGDLPPDGGEARLELPPEQVAYLDQRAALLRPDRSVLDNVLDADPAVDPNTAHRLLARLLFRGDAARARVADLSGGERIRAALARVLVGPAPPKLLVLDEPTNHLDLDSLRAAEDVLAAYDGALVLVSHDAAFLEAVGVQRTIAL